MIKGSLHQENVTIVNIYAPNITAPKHFKQIPTDLKGESDNTIIVGDCLPWGGRGSMLVDGTWVPGHMLLDTDVLVPE